MDSIFGIDSWTFLAKDGFGSDSDNAAALGVTGGTISGTFNISASLYSMYEQFALVLKGGNGADNPEYIAYNITSSMGSYESPFFKTNKGKVTQQDISHISLYGYGMPTPSEVPVPAAGLLLIGGLGGLVAARRRKAKKA